MPQTGWLTHDSLFLTSREAGGPRSGYQSGRDLRGAGLPVPEWRLPAASAQGRRGGRAPWGPFTSSRVPFMKVSLSQPHCHPKTPLADAIASGVRGQHGTRGKGLQRRVHSPSLSYDVDTQTGRKGIETQKRIQVQVSVFPNRPRLWKGDPAFLTTTCRRRCVLGSGRGLTAEPGFPPRDLAPEFFVAVLRDGPTTFVL
uniref:Uncharacterized protein n=1 Tax=Rousettus aegyptiacus TaxID=9407 RepID=A0A7J8KAE8_ROUAE|nr:hypothetical protein HJG63_007738 [Rousettus aegyptiacus]